MDRHIQLPNDLGQELDIKPTDQLIYLAIKSF